MPDDVLAASRGESSWVSGEETEAERVLRVMRELQDSRTCALATPARYDGYAVVWRDGETRYAHVVAWEDANGPVPDGLHVDHLCNARNCVNGKHLELVTQAVNNQRAGWRKTACINGHQYSKENTYVRPDTGRRGCRTCRTKQAKASKQRSADHGA